MIDPSPAIPAATQFVEGFLKNVRAAVPLGIEQIEMMLGLLSADGLPVSSFLDLGCGNAVLSAAILGEHPGARGVLVDLSPALLASARVQVRPYRDRVEFVAADFTQPSWAETLANQPPFDAIISAFAIHGLSDGRKRELYAELFKLLRPDGILINFEHVSSATRWTESVWDDAMIGAIFGEQIKAQPHQPRTEIAREYYERILKDGAAHAPLEVQCAWLREIGFESVECFLKVSELAMFGGQKPA